MRFYVFPFRQKIYIIYSSKKVLKSKLFGNFYTQLSAKNSIFFRILKSDLARPVSGLLRQSIAVPNEVSDYVGHVKNGTILLVELDDNLPVNVWRKAVNKNWVREDFIGYQLISEYTLTEFAAKYSKIEEALRIHWEAVNESPKNIHGDLTHFNILLGKNDEYFFIDRKSTNHSKLFDFFYFYAYLLQCLNKSTTLNTSDRSLIIMNLESIISKVCCYSNNEACLSDLLNLQLPEVSGVDDFDSYLKSFRAIFDSSRLYGL